jgi:hypothetical protein
LPVLDALQHRVPAKLDPPSSAAFIDLSLSVNDTLTFPNLGAADTWRNQYPDLAVAGKLAAIGGQVHTLRGNTWTPVATIVKAATGQAAAASLADPATIFYEV